MGKSVDPTGSSRIFLSARCILASCLMASCFHWVAGSQAAPEDPMLLYPYTLSSSSTFGRILDSALPGSEVPIDHSLSQEHEQEAGDAEFLRLELSENPYYNESTPTNDTETSTDDLLTSLPSGIIWDVSRVKVAGEASTEMEVKSLFTVNERFMIVLHDNDFPDAQEVEFWVVAVRQVGEGQYEAVSNPLAFIVTLEHQNPKREGAVVYVGVIVLIVCLFVIVIPLSVRTQRRRREGKPLCACGSSQEKLDERKRKEAEAGIVNGSFDAVETISDRRVNPNVAALFHHDDPGMKKWGTSSAAPNHETFQQKMLRSESDHHFQPRWLDPHYKDVYEHPVYKMPSVMAVQSKTSGTGTSTATVTVDTNGKSAPDRAAAATVPGVFNQRL